MLHRIPFPDPVQFSKIAKTSEIPAGIHKNFPDDFHAPPPPDKQRFRAKMRLVRQKTSGLTTF